MKKLFTITVLLFVLVPGPHFSFAGGKPLVTGEDFLNLTEQEKSWLLVGTHGLYLKAAEKIEYRTYYLKLAHCIEDMSHVQLAAMLTKYLKDNPHTWHLFYSEPLHDAIEQACKRLSRK